MRRLNSILLSLFTAVGGFAAAAAPSNGSFEELAGYVPSGSGMIMFVDAGKLHDSGWLKQLDKLPLAKDMVPDAGVESGNVVMFASNPADRDAAIALLYNPEIDSLDKLMAAEAASFAEVGSSPVKTMVCNMDAFSVSVPKLNVTTYYAMLEPHWFIMGMSEKAIAEYLATPSAELGLNAEQMKQLAPYKGEAIFGTVVLPASASAGMDGIDIVGVLRDDTLTVRTISRYRVAAAAEQMESQMVAMKPMLGTLLEQQMPGCGKLLADAITVSRAGNNVTIAFTFTPELFAKMAEAGKSMEASGASVLPRE
ncbi:MAG: hypothetical protein AB7F40_05365 [Victivallaceae bacterium]|nr:hypothetical protein [Victivallaceae bacterium]